MRKICILGSGYAGIFCAANLLADYDNRSKYEISIFDQNSYHQLLQQIHLVAANIKKPNDISFSVYDLLKDDIKFYNELIVGINLDKQKIFTAHNKEFDLDYVIIALGSSNAFFGIKGAKEYSQSFRSLDDAIKLQKKIQNLEDSNIKICGGGATGISLAGALSEISKKNLNITIVEAQSDILPGWNPKLVKAIKKFLINNKVNLITNNPIKEVYPSSVLLDDGTIIEESLSIWTAGVKGTDIQIIPQIRKTRSNRIIVNKLSQIEQYNNAFAAGDISAFPLDNGQISPQLAQFAVRQAMNIAKNILRKEKGEKMLEFQYEQQGSIISLGNRCIGMINGIIINGSLCHYVEDFLIDNYIKTIKNRGTGISTLAYQQDKLSQISSSLNFMITTAAKILSSN
ncbi:MAG TPA: FAD-dependent oxidoreductase [Nitrososphaeraceae archaeon]|nr:FAD-dependent oxidoreductase [Nitrososphaeraceae archaeon]